MDREDRGQAALVEVTGHGGQLLHGLVGLLVEVHGDRHVAEGEVEVDQQGPVTARGEVGREVGGHGRLADATLGREDGDHATGLLVPLARCTAQPGRELEAASARVGQRGQVVGGDHLAGAGPQGVAEHGDVEPLAQQDHAHLGTVDPHGLHDLAGRIEVDVGADDDEQLGGRAGEGAGDGHARLRDHEPGTQRVGVVLGRAGVGVPEDGHVVALTGVECVVGGLVTGRGTSRRPSRSATGPPLSPGARNRACRSGWRARVAWSRWAAGPR